MQIRVALGLISFLLPVPTLIPASTALLLSVSSLPASAACTAIPSACGYPDATNTGVPDNVTLRRIPFDASSGRGWHWDKRGWVVIDGDGVTFSGYQLNTNIDVYGDNVVISNVKITFAGEGFGIAVRHAHNTTITNCEISGLDMGSGRMLAAVKNIYGDETGTTVYHCDISKVSTGIQIDGGLIAGNYIHDLGRTGDDHVNGVTSNSEGYPPHTGEPLTIRHNTIFNQYIQTDAIGLFEDFGSPPIQHHRTIDSNLVAGGGYSIYAGQNSGGAATHHIVVKNNRFSRKFFANGGYHGPVTAYSRSGLGNVWSGNFWDNTGARVLAP